MRLGVHLNITQPSPSASSSSSSSAASQTPNTSRKRTGHEAVLKEGKSSAQPPPAKRRKIEREADVDEKQQTRQENQQLSSSSSSSSSSSQESKISFSDADPSSKKELWGWELFKNTEKDIRDKLSEITHLEPNAKFSAVASHLKIIPSELDFIKKNIDSKMQFMTALATAMGKTPAASPPDLNSSKLNDLLAKTQEADASNAFNKMARLQNLAKKIILYLIIGWVLDENTVKLSALNRVFSVERDTELLLNVLSNQNKKRPSATYFNLSSNIAEAEISKFQKRLSGHENRNRDYQAFLSGRRVYLNGKKVWPINSDENKKEDGEIPGQFLADVEAPKQFLIGGKQESANVPMKLDEPMKSKQSLMHVEQVPLGHSAALEPTHTAEVLYFPLDPEPFSAPELYPEHSLSSPEPFPGGEDFLGNSHHLGEELPLEHDEPPPFLALMSSLPGTSSVFTEQTPSSSSSTTGLPKHFDSPVGFPSYTCTRRANHFGLPSSTSAESDPEEQPQESSGSSFFHP